ncbi:retrovirus-related pol polyprotein from transposon TNT 1-94 [Tanacetum coccineum]|uniref:Retrovirus-related pol polyprotein from transposon TNT 1-94 n=1 Tax=Tanacetum coccineum TaxID=301880 RepID=A0ABQ4YYS4_9ASTR
MNLRLLRSLPSEWKTHALIWRNKEEIETISLDDLYNNLKIYEPELTGSTNTSQNLQNVAFVSSNSTNSNSNSSTNEADNTTYEVSAAHTQSYLTSGDNLSDVVICAFVEEMHLQWEIAMVTIRARRFIKRTGKKLDVNGQRENKGRENSRRTVTVETPTENALVAQDGIGGYDWSYQAEEENPINYALMTYKSSGSSSSLDSEVDSCSKSCVKAYATLKEQYDSLSSDYKKSQFNLVSYKAGLESVEARLAHYKKNEVVFEESINVLNLEVKLRDNALVENKKKLEKAEKERDELKLTLEKFQNLSKSLNNLLESQVCDKFKTGLGYNAASPAVESFVNSSKGITREFSVARTPQQNGVAEKKNRTLIEAARTMLVDSKLPTTFWAKAVNTACYVLNRVLVIKPYNRNKTPYELIHGRTPLINFMKPFRYSVLSKAMRIFNKRTRIVEETLNIRFLENAPNVTGNGPDWLFDVDSLTISMNYVPVVAGNQTNGIAGKRDNIVAVNESGAFDKGEDDEQDTRSKFERLLQQEKQTNSTNSFNTVGTPVSVAGPTFTNDDPSSPVNAGEASNAFEDHLFERFSPFKNAFTLPHVPNMFSINDTRIFGNAYDDEYVGAEAALDNLETTMNVSHIPTTRIDKDHPKDQIIRDLNSAIQTRKMTKIF